MPWIGDHGFLAPGAVQPAGEALLALLHDCFPITEYVTDPDDWWRVAGPALVARAGRTLESVLILFEHRCDLDAATLTRTLLEQLLTFAYLSHAPEQRLLAYESADLAQSEKIVSGVRRLGHSMSDADGWSAVLGPRPKALALHVDQLADHADSEWPWAPRVFFKGTEQPFRLLYEAVYRTASRAVHGKAYATGPFVDLSRQPTVLIRAAERRTSAIGYELAVWCFAIMLVIAGDSLGRPLLDDVVAAAAPHLP